MLSIGNYQLQDTLGTGSFGKVKLAMHQLTQHQVAIKILNKKKIKSLEMLGKIKREIQILKLFSHPHIIKLYEVISTPTDIFMVMEYVSGGELFEYIVKNGRLSEAQARKFFQQIIGGVEYCHRHNVVHRDLKPENLLLDSNFNVKIADFGLSNIMTDGDFLRTSCGSPNYAAPEVISGKLYAGPEVDVWSCGVILYALLCGNLPFDDEYIPALFKKIKRGVFVMPSHVSTEAQELLIAMLDVDPLKRATIHWIRHTPWFLKNLPDYLMVDANHTDTKAAIDHETIAIVAENMLSTVEEVLTAILTGASNDPLKIAYHLVNSERHIHGKSRNDKKQYSPITNYEGNEEVKTNNILCEYIDIALPLDEITDIPRKQNHSRTRSNTYGDKSAAKVINENEGTEDARYSNVAGGSITHQHPQSIDTMPRNEVLRIEDLPVIGHTYAYSTGNLPHHITKKPTFKNKWHLGIRSRSYPNEVMLEVYKAMKRLNLVWKTANFYHVFCKMENAETNRTMKISLQLYKVDEKHYLLDFRNLAMPENEELGSVTMGFFEMCALLIKELAVPSK